MAEHGGYTSGHPWYYRLGGRILRISEIRDEAIASGSRGALSHEVDRIDSLPLDKKPSEIAFMREHLTNGLIASARRYRHHAARVRYRRRWLGPYADEDRDMWNEPTTGLTLTHNHLFNGFASLHALDALSNVQMEMF